MRDLMPKEWRLISDLNAHAFKNMAVDEAIALCSSSVIARSETPHLSLRGMKSRSNPIGLWQAYQSHWLGAGSAISKKKIASPLARNDGGSKSTIRFYTWKKPTVSIGYFQRITPVINWLNNNPPHPPFCKGGYRGIVDIVRRPTGGGVVLHGADLTYSVATGLPRGFAHRNDNSSRNLIPPFYKYMGQAVIEGLRLLGITASQESGDKNQELTPPFIPPFARGGQRGGGTQDSRLSLCTQMPVEFDVLVEGIKVAGCAARRFGDALLLQGYISIGHIADITAQQLIDAMIKGFAVSLDIELLHGKLTDEEASLAEELNNKKYSRREWNYRR